MTIPHPLDVAFSALSGRRTLFADGWGDEELLLSMASSFPFSKAPGSVDAVTPAWGPVRAHRRGRVCDGSFVSPSDLLPKESQTAHVRWLMASSPPRYGQRAACLLLAGSREEGFRQRERIYGALTERGVDLFLLENPYYGTRRPAGQRGGSVRTVSDHVRMNAATVVEARALLSYLRTSGYERILVTGYSMGAYMAALTAALTPSPVGVAVLAGGASPAPVFTHGLLSRAIRFARLGGSDHGAKHAADAARERLAQLWEVANVARFSPPTHPQAAIIVACERDGFVPLAEARALHAHWPGSELRLVNAGHVSALFTCTHALRAAVCDGLARLVV